MWLEATILDGSFPLSSTAIPQWGCPSKGHSERPRQGAGWLLPVLILDFKICIWLSGE